MLDAIPFGIATLRERYANASRILEEERMRSLIHPSCDEIVRSLLLSRDAIGDVRKGDRRWKAS
ncbi:MAG: hypothetical protein F6K28_14215 [Microcoleus sp. SIO2G3]|nr:hypothetical protein [Microcoleus sp. SIO2G3]